MPQTNNDIFTDEEKEEAKRQKIADMEAATANAVMKSIADKYEMKHEILRTNYATVLVLPLDDSKIEISFSNNLVMEWKEILPNLLEYFSMKRPFSEIEDYLIKCHFAFAECDEKKYAIYMNGIKKFEYNFFHTSFQESEKRNGPFGIFYQPFYKFIKLLKLPIRVESIGDDVFDDCSSLESIKIPDGVTEIGRGAFEGCKSLKMIELPYRVRSIERNVFLNCESLESIVIPSEVQSISTSAFEGCQSLKSIKLPAKITKIPSRTFRSCSSLKLIDIPIGVIKIGKYAFAECTSLSSIVLPAGIKSIGEYVFFDCLLLESIELSANMKYIGKHAFDDCLSLESIKIPIEVESIGESAFKDCLLLKTITYSGTMEQWRKISKGEQWNEEVPAKVVHCADGDISLNS